MFYAFKLNPKQQVEAKAKRLFGRDIKVKVLGARLSPIDSKRLDVPTGSYHVTCQVNGKEIAQAYCRDWRKAYGLLVIEVEKAYQRSLEAPTQV